MTLFVYTNDVLKECCTSSNKSPWCCDPAAQLFSVNGQTSVLVAPTLIFKIASVN